MGHPVLRCQANMGLPSGEAAEPHHTPLPARDHDGCVLPPGSAIGALDQAFADVLVHYFSHRKHYFNLNIKKENAYEHREKPKPE